MSEKGKVTFTATIIKSGLNGNGDYFPPETLRAMARILAHGMPVYDRPKNQHGAKRIGVVKGSTTDGHKVDVEIEADAEFNLGDKIFFNQ